MIPNANSLLENLPRINWTYDSNLRHNIWHPLKTDKGLPQWSYMTNTGYEDSIAITPEQIYETDLKYSEMETFSSRAYTQIEYLIKYIKHNNLNELLDNIDSENLKRTSRRGLRDSLMFF